MKNTVIAQVNYSFKGEDFTPFIVLEMDVFAQHHADFSSLCRTIAQKNTIDTYSYAYDVMESSAVIFHSPTGNVVDFVAENQCDLVAYQQYLTQEAMYCVINNIAENVLGLNDLSQKKNEKIKKALVDAYWAGMQSVIKE